MKLTMEASKAQVQPPFLPGVNVTQTTWRLARVETAASDTPLKALLFQTTPTSFTSANIFPSYLSLGSSMTYFSSTTF